MTDQEIDSILEQQKPHMRAAYRLMFEKGQPYVALKMAQQTLPNGAVWDIMMLWASEPVANLIQGTLTGYMGAMQSMGKLAPLTGTGAKPQPTGNAFGIPVG
jgi:hypothetical protein